MHDPEDEGSGAYDAAMDVSARLKMEEDMLMQEELLATRDNLQRRLGVSEAVLDAVSRTNEPQETYKSVMIEWNRLKEEETQLMLEELVATKNNLGRQLGMSESMLHHLRSKADSEEAEIKRLMTEIGQLEKDLEMMAEEELEVEIAMLEAEAEAKKVLQKWLVDDPGWNPSSQTTPVQGPASDSDELYDTTPSHLRFRRQETANVLADPASKEDPAITVEELRPILLPTLRRLAEGSRDFTVPWAAALREISRESRQSVGGTTFLRAIHELEDAGEVQEFGFGLDRAIRLLTAKRDEQLEESHQAPLQTGTPSSPPLEQSGTPSAVRGSSDSGPINTQKSAPTETQKTATSAAEADSSGHVHSHAQMLANIEAARKDHQKSAATSSSLPRSNKDEWSALRQLYADKAVDDRSAAAMVKLIDVALTIGPDPESKPGMFRFALKDLGSMSLSDISNIAARPTEGDLMTYGFSSAFYDLPTIAKLVQAKAGTFDSHCLLLAGGGVSDNWLSEDVLETLEKFTAAREILKKHHGVWPENEDLPANRFHNTNTDQMDFESLPIVTPDIERIVMPYRTSEHLLVSIIEPDLQSPTGERIGTIRSYNSWNPLREGDDPKDLAKWYDSNNMRRSISPKAREIATAVAQLFNEHPGSTHWQQDGWQYQEARPLEEVVIQNDPFNCGPLTAFHAEILMQRNEKNIPKVLLETVGKFCQDLRDMHMETIRDAALAAHEEGQES